MKYYFIIIIFIGNVILFGQTSSYIDSTKLRDPSIAWKLSIVPGLGQFYNKKSIKGGFFLGIEYAATQQFIKYKDSNIALRNTYAWWIFGLYILNILDAYVDAQLSTFPIKHLESTYQIDSLKNIIK